MLGEQRAGEQDEEIASIGLFIILWSYKQTCESKDIPNQSVFVIIISNND